MIIDGTKEKLLTPAEQRQSVAANYVKSQGVPAVEDSTPRNWAAEQRQATADSFADRAKPDAPPIAKDEQRRLHGLAVLENNK